MHATPLFHHQSYSTQPKYTFYYTTSNRYCAFDPVSGDHFIHSLNDNRWYPYFPAQELPTVKHKNHDHYAPHFNTYDGFEVRESRHREAGESGRHCSRGRDRLERENLLYTAAAVESARRSLLEEDIGMDSVYEEELNLHGGDWWHSTSRSGGKHGPKVRGHVREEHSYDHRRNHSPHPSPRRRHVPPHHARAHDGYHHREETYHHSHQHQPQRYHHHDSKKAYVGSPGSDHDSGYFEYLEDFEPAPSPRKAMPGIAKWLDNILVDEGLDFEEEELDMGFRARSRRRESQAYDEQRPYYSDDDAQRRTDYRRSAEERAYETHHDRQPEWEASSPDTYNINIEINMDTDQGYETHHSHQAPKYQTQRHHHNHENAEKVIYQEENYNCYYAVPPQPSPPAAAARSPTEARRTGRFTNKPTTCYQPNSIYSAPETIRYPTYRQYLPRAPSPPMSPVPFQRRSSGGEGVRYVKPEPRLRGRRTW